MWDKGGGGLVSPDSLAEASRDQLKRYALPDHRGTGDSWSLPARSKGHGARTGAFEKARACLGYTNHRCAEALETWS